MKVSVGRSKLLIGMGLALAAGVALTNRSLLLDDLPPTLPGTMIDWTWRGWRVRYTTMGEGSPVVLVHGVHAAASPFEMRGIFEPLSQRHTVYALELLGFAKSERPDTTYTGRLYAELVADFLAEVVARPALLVGSSLGAAYVVAAARARPDLAEGLVLFSPTGITSSGPIGRAFGGLLRLPLVGTAAFNMLVSYAGIQSYLRRAYADPAVVDEPLVEQHWATAHQPNARLAPAAFVAGWLDLPLNAAGQPVAAPILVLRGSVRGIGAQATDADLRRLGPNVTIETLDGAGQLPHDEAPDRVLDAIRAWQDGEG